MLKNITLSKIPLYSILFLFATTALAFAQEAEFKPEVAPPEKTLTLLQLIKAGGITMIPLGLFSIAVLALVVRACEC